MARHHILLRKPALLVWILFGAGIISFMIGTLNPVPDTEVDRITLLGEALFGSGIIVGAILVIKSKRR